VDEAERIYRLTALSTVEERFVVPTAHREVPRRADRDAEARKQSSGFGPGAWPVKGSS
jgi:nitrate reductase beta subunit